MWSEKYRPQIISDMIGNEEPRAAIMEWFVKWKKGTKPLLLVGPPGIGKTTIAYLMAKQFGYDMIGLNASDVRSKSRINEILTERGVDQATTTQFIEILKSCEFARYTPASMDTMKQDYDKAANVISTLDKQL